MVLKRTYERTNSTSAGSGVLVGPSDPGPGTGIGPSLDMGVAMGVGLSPSLGTSVFSK